MTICSRRLVGVLRPRKCSNPNKVSAERKKRNKRPINLKSKHINPEQNTVIVAHWNSGKPQGWPLSEFNLLFGHSAKMLPTPAKVIV